MCRESVLRGQNLRAWECPWWKPWWQNVGSWKQVLSVHCFCPCVCLAPQPHFGLTAAHLRVWLCALSPALPRYLLPERKLEGLLRDIEGHGSKKLLKTILGLCNLWVPHHPTLTIPDLSSLWAIWLVRPRITQPDDPHPRPPQTLLLGLGRAEQPCILCSLDLLYR